MPCCMMRKIKGGTFKVKVNIVAAAITLQNTGSIIGPYFLGKSLEIIREKFGKKISNSNFELKEIGIERVRSLRGFNSAREKIERGTHSACLISE